MKIILTIFAVSSLSGLFVSAQPTTAEALVSELRAACEQKDGAKYDALMYFEGASDADKAAVAGIRFDWGGGMVSDMSLVPLPKDFDLVNIGRGRKFELTHPPTGLVKIDITGSKYGSGSGKMSSSVPYANIDGKYFIVAMKSTDLGWKGPVDGTLGFFVSGDGAENVTIEYCWNASGVDQTKKSVIRSLNFIGQHINWLKVTSDSTATNVTLKIDKDGKEIYLSDPLKGIGMLEYKKPD